MLKIAKVKTFQQNIWFTRQTSTVSKRKNLQLVFRLIQSALFFCVFDIKFILSKSTMTLVVTKRANETSSYLFLAVTVFESNGISVRDHNLSPIKFRFWGITFPPMDGYFSFSNAIILTTMLLLRVFVVDQVVSKFFAIFDLPFVVTSA